MQWVALGFHVNTVVYLIVDLRDVERKNGRDGLLCFLLAEVSERDEVPVTKLIRFALYWREFVKTTIILSSCAC